MAKKVGNLREIAVAAFAPDRVPSLRPCLEPRPITIYKISDQIPFKVPRNLYSDKMHLVLPLHPDTAKRIRAN